MSNCSGGNPLAVGCTSVIIALTTFIGILCYRILQQVRHIKLWKKVPKLNLKLNKLNTKQVVNNPINDPAESVNLDQLREPWLEDLLQPTHSSLWAFFSCSLYSYNNTIYQLAVDNPVVVLTVEQLTIFSPSHQFKLSRCFLVFSSLLFRQDLLV